MALAGIGLVKDVPEFVQTAMAIRRRIAIHNQIPV
jgi:hypothetical protein